MLTDATPTALSTDEYIIAWARARGGDRYAFCKVPLGFGVEPRAADEAEIDFTQHSPTVRRYRATRPGE